MNVTVPAGDADNDGLPESCDPNDDIFRGSPAKARCISGRTQNNDLSTIGLATGMTELLAAAFR